MSIPWGTGLPTIKVYSDATQATLQKTLYLPPCDKRGVTLSWRKKFIAQDLVDGSERQRVLGYIPVLNLRWKHFNDTDHRGLGFGQNDGNMLTLADLQEILALTPGRLRVSPGLSRATRTATHQPFFTGDGVTQSAQLLGLVDGRLVPAKRNLNATIYRTDWQGQQLLYSTARTNRCLWSNDITNAAWTKRGTCAAALTANGPDGGINNATNITGLGDGGANDFFNTNYASFGLPNNGNYTPSFWLKRVSTTGTLLAQNPQNSALGAMVIDLSLIGSGWVWVTPSSAGVTVTSPFVAGATGSGGLQFVGQVGAPLSIQLFGLDCKSGVVASSTIQTTTAAVTVTDYTLSGTGLFLPSPVPAVGSVFDWSGTFSDTPVGFAANVTKHPDYRPVVAGLGGDVEVEFAGRDILPSPVLVDF